MEVMEVVVDGGNGGGNGNNNQPQNYSYTEPPFEVFRISPGVEAATRVLQSKKILLYQVRRLEKVQLWESIIKISMM